MNAEEERTRKHEFLQIEIIDKQYNPEAFIAYCNEDRGADIDLWSFEELKACVGAFTNQVLSNQSTDRDLVECKTLRPSRLSPESIKVIITKPEKTQSTLFSLQTIQYYVVTLPMGWSVQRKKSDFKWLQEALAIEFPGIYVPNIPELSKKKLEDPLNLNIQIKQLNLFINYVVTSDLFKRSLNLITFLEEENLEKFEKVKKNKGKKAMDVRNFFTSDGRITCEYADLKEFTDKNAQILDQNREAMKRLACESKKMKVLTGELAVSIKNYSMLLNEFSNISKFAKVNARPMSELFGKTSDAFGKISEMVWKSTLTINECFNGTFKFLLNQSDSLKEIYKEKDLIFQDLEKMKKKISNIASKDKGVSKEITDKCAALKEKAGVYNYCCREQTEKFCVYSGRILYEDCGEFINKITSNTTGILTVLAMLQDSLEISKSNLR